jgi:hypothetical protein
LEDLTKFLGVGDQDLGSGADGVHVSRYLV